MRLLESFNFSIDFRSGVSVLVIDSLGLSTREEKDKKGAGGDDGHDEDSNEAASRQRGVICRRGDGRGSVYDKTVVLG